jgi:hypothetical protein
MGSYLVEIYTVAEGLRVIEVSRPRGRDGDLFYEMGKVAELELGGGRGRGEERGRERRKGFSFSRQILFIRRL